MITLEINYINNSNETSWKNYKQFLEPILDKTCQVLGKENNVATSVVLVHDETIHQYNKSFRNIDRETDVLSFENGEVEDGIFQMGDIIISVDAIRRQAKDYGHSLKREFCFLVVHGYLHLFGFDHQTPDTEKEMIELQKEILDGLADRFD